MSAPSPSIDDRLMAALTTLALRAGEVILATRENGFALRAKADLSPVTAADEASEAVLLEGLARLLPGVPVVSEEQPERSAIGPADSMFVLVDPLDGTREFIAGRDEFTVNVGLVIGGSPVAGVVAAPARGQVWRGVAGRGAERVPVSGTEIGTAESIHTRRLPAGNPIALVSRSHPDAATQALLDRLGVASREPCGSALKFGLLAQGGADIYARLAPTSAWDIAAGHAVVAAAGGDMRRPDGTPLRYAGLDAACRIPSFIACGDPAAFDRLA